MSGLLTFLSISLTFLHITLNDGDVLHVVMRLCLAGKRDDTSTQLRVSKRTQNHMTQHNIRTLTLPYSIHCTLPRPYIPTIPHSKK